MKQLKDKWNSQNKLSIKNTQLKIRFGITLNEYNNLLEKQNNQCAICFIHQGDIKKKFAVDHNHETGKIRGLLCHHCNVGLGHFRDNVDFLQSAILYLQGL